jgi:hypothetical protein
MANDTRGNRQFSWLRQLAYRICYGNAPVLQLLSRNTSTLKKMNGHGRGSPLFSMKDAWS